MSPQDVIDITQSAVWTMVVMLLPILVPALIVGVTIALFQTLTQIQEMSLTFGPKIFVTFLALALFLPFLITTLVEYTQGLYDRIIAIG